MSVIRAVLLHWRRDRKAAGSVTESRIDAKMRQAKEIADLVLPCDNSATGCWSRDRVTVRVERRA